MIEKKEIHPSLKQWAIGSLFKRNEKALVVMSGGQDSTTCLGVALKQHNEVHAIGFDYGQKHAVELEAAAHICKQYDVPFTVVKVPSLANMKSSALVNHGDVSKPHEILKDVPASFVPARNAMFLTMSWGYALENDIKHLYTGVCQTDYSGYPDCRQDFIVLMEAALRTGYTKNLSIHTPLMFLDKAQTFLLAEEVGILLSVIKDSHTCYNGDHKTRHEWGHGCGECPACELREKGYNEYLERFKTNE